MSEKKLAEVVGENIHTRRRKLGLTQEAFAEKIGVWQDSISRIENGNTSPNFEKLQIIADTLGCSVVDLFRVPGDKLEEHAAEFIDLIKPFSPRAQQQMLNMVAQMAKMLHEGK